MWCGARESPGLETSLSLKSPRRHLAMVEGPPEVVSSLTANGTRPRHLEDHSKTRYDEPPHTPHTWTASLPPLPPHPTPCSLHVPGEVRTGLSAFTGCFHPTVDSHNIGDLPCERPHVSCKRPAPPSRNEDEIRSMLSVRVEISNCFLFF